MRMTIIKDDSNVTIDGEGYRVDCSTLPATFHALQWYGDRGEVEYKMTRCDHCGARSRKGNDLITDLSPYMPYVEAWRAAKAAYDAETVRLALEAQTKAEAKANAAGPET